MCSCLHECMYACIHACTHVCMHEFHDVVVQIRKQSTVCCVCFVCKYPSFASQSSHRMVHGRNCGSCSMHLRHRPQATMMGRCCSIGVMCTWCKTLRHGNEHLLLCDCQKSPVLQHWRSRLHACSLRGPSIFLHRKIPHLLVKDPHVYIYIYM